MNQPYPNQNYRPLPPQQPQYPAQGYYAPYPYAQPAPKLDELGIRKLRAQEAEKVVRAKSGSSWSSLQIKPDVKFATQNPGERIYVLARKHWINNIGWISNNIIYCIIPFLIYAIIQFFSVQIAFIPTRVVILFVFAYYSVIFTNVFRDFLDWYYDHYIVTNERVISYEFNPFTSYKIRDIPLESIEGVKERSVGIFASILDYGDIIISTEASQDVMLFVKVPRATRVRDIIFDLSNIAKKIKNGD